MHALERQADQLQAAGIWPDAPTAPGVRAAARRSPGSCQRRMPAGRACQPRPHVLLVPGRLGASAGKALAGRAPTATWPRSLRGQGYDVVIIGGPEDSALAHAIQRIAPRARDLTGRTDFAQIAALGARAALAVGNDTGPMHLIAAAGAPTWPSSPRPPIRAALRPARPCGRAPGRQP